MQWAGARPRWSYRNCLPLLILAVSSPIANPMTWLNAKNALTELQAAIAEPFQGH